MSEELRNSHEFAITVETLRQNPGLDHDTVVEVVDDVFRSNPQNVRDEIIVEIEKTLHVSPETPSWPII